MAKAAARSSREQMKPEALKGRLTQASGTPAAYGARIFSCMDTSPIIYMVKKRKSCSMMLPAVWSLNLTRALSF